VFFFFQAEDGIRDFHVTGVQTCALPILVAPTIAITGVPFVTSHTQTLNDAGLAVSRKFPKGTPVIAIVGATIGNTGVLAYDMCRSEERRVGKEWRHRG